MATISSSKIGLLASQVHSLATEVQYRLDHDSNVGPKSQLIDALDDLRAELLEPAEWCFSFLAVPDFAALQVAFQRAIFQHVPLPSSPSANSPDPPCVHVKDLASSVGVDEDKLLRIMRLLEANRVFREVQEKQFAHTPISAAMAGEYVAAHLGGQLNYLFQASSSLADAIEGHYPSAWEARFGMPLYKHFETQKSEDRARFAKSMVEYSRQEMKQVSAIFPWETVCNVVDVGGGAGHLAAYLARVRLAFSLPFRFTSLLLPCIPATTWKEQSLTVVSQNHLHLHFVNQDLPMVVNDAARRVALLPLDEKVGYERVAFEAHDYYEPQPRSNMDAFILRHCLHNNPDDRCTAILRAIVPGLENGRLGSRLLIIEKVLPPWGTPLAPYQAKWLRREDVVMMIGTGGKERTLEDFKMLVEEADKRLTPQHAYPLKQIDQVYHGENNAAVIAVRLRSVSDTVGAEPPVYQD
ncbi:MAG: hypothetical protein Q9211_001812 [Gyalolechia sp. 1 TL-2023]